jgi:mono/diheme cytochrome c family protein
MRPATLAAWITGGLAIGLAGFFVLTLPRAFPIDTLAPRVPDLANGATMFIIGGCASCHAKDARNAPEDLGGGHPLKTKFGTFRAPNISTHPVAGIGAWTEAEFLTAMVEGVGRKGEHLFPAFPYTSYRRMRVDDLRDLFAHMRTLPSNATPSAPHAILFPFNIRRTLGIWKLLFLDAEPFRRDVARGDDVDRGAYLVEGPGHCAECHSRRNALGGIIAAGRMAGGPNAEGKGFVPNITQHPKDGLGAWSLKDIESLLEKGGTPAGGFVGDEMEDVVANTSRLSAEDRRAMALYLKQIPPAPSIRTDRK